MAQNVGPSRLQRLGPVGLSNCLVGVAIVVIPTIIEIAFGKSLLEFLLGGFDEFARLSQRQDRRENVVVVRRTYAATIFVLYALDVVLAFLVPQVADGIPQGIFTDQNFSAAQSARTFSFGTPTTNLLRCEMW